MDNAKFIDNAYQEAHRALLRASIDPRVTPKDLIDVGLAFGWLAQHVQSAR